ncbi:hypothetical protein ILYODFUR_035369 [Ilyodon furcidens]|uniref:Uncharacterized protein n=1 Tax=Ilyodon furcidens TaxID=33524 RepID=A0ABV0U280_9TELE
MFCAVANKSWARLCALDRCYAETSTVIPCGGFRVECWNYLAVDLDQPPCAFVSHSHNPKHQRPTSVFHSRRDARFTTGLGDSSPNPFFGCEVLEETCRGLSRAVQVTDLL